MRGEACAPLTPTSWDERAWVPAGMHAHARMRVHSRFLYHSQASLLPCAAMCSPSSHLRAYWQGALVERWNAARAQAEYDEQLDAEQAEPSLALLEQRKRQRLVEWRERMELEEETTKNNNFVPLGGVDWRERVRQRREEARADK